MHIHFYSNHKPKTCNTTQKKRNKLKNNIKDTYKITVEESKRLNE